MEEKIKDIFLILLVGAVAVATYYFYQNYFGVGINNNQNEPNIEIIEGGSTATSTNKTTTTSTKNTTTGTKTTTTKTSTITPEGVYLIYYYKSGFSPNDLTIKRGTSVRFINKSSTSMRVFATDQSDLFHKQLNQSQTVGYDGVYEYTFTQVGLWEYTNATNNIHLGKILVY
ncbi:hypothetical protein A2996_02375 [Candidatus Campbellbacteria bacterium RIFCSPLOWO2_01_FULL_34_15]|jgi:plastocyanin|uniref:EfeO-type cupredoxin-like domain-containing protein n=2 Tax=Candidatus Campbelliibacteriota TaxID=1752727 RepID=A0A1F5ELX2_9BACT|nr:MAG: hypothetical protein A2811_01420 [Candidatus Campbellbacteria bacterium RIFCSPHIGHO2_01_FULL_34_10]OGD68392.1 MAG: hypothetical protein A2996_02375 [Candidatus Campbellbacteria bacterium RIFCSPLOWO2_01_FULL_34_15]